MKFREIFRFELACQLRSVRNWVCFAIVLGVAFASIHGDKIDDARRGDYVLNSPFAIASVTVLGSLVWLLLAAAVAGEAATRDVRARMHPLTYTAPVRKSEYLGGRFLAAFAVNALILLAVPAGALLAVLLPGVEPGILGPFRPAAYLSSYLLIALPTALAATAIQFSLASLSRRSVASYLGSVLVFATAYGVATGVGLLVQRGLGKLLDPLGVITVWGDLSRAWTPAEKNARLVGVQASMLANRLLWVAIALGVLAFTHRRFRFAHPAEGARKGRAARRRDAVSAASAGAAAPRSAPVSVPPVRRSFGLATHARQTVAVARTSFRTAARSRAGLVLLAVIAMLTALYIHGHMAFYGVPLVPRTDRVLAFLTAPLTDPRTPWVIIPLLTVFYAGEVVWRERETGLSEIADAAPVPEWALLLGRFLGLALVLVAWVALLTAAGVLVQALMGYHDLQIGRYLQVLFGLQLADYLLFAVLALVIHAVAGEKHAGYLAALAAYGFIAFAPALGIEHNLLVYGSDPGWSYTDMRGLGTSLGPWLWFKVYWAAWALLLAVAARLLWARGREGGLAARLRTARARLTPPAAWAAAVAAGLVLALGGFIFYNTNVLNRYRSAAGVAERSAEYERRYGRFAGAPQPWVTGASLRVEIYPGRGQVEIRGSYRLLNRGTVPIDSVHVATAAGVETGGVTLDRPAARVLADPDLGYHIYALARPLQPGDSLRLGFVVRYRPRGFRNRGADPWVAPNGTSFTNEDWLPAIGYQLSRELEDPGARRAHGLARRPAVPSLYDLRARLHRAGGEPITFDAVVGTDAGQVAVAPGTLRRTWTEGGRRYFHYSTDAPIRNQYAFFSARYALREARWGNVAIQIFHHPGHTANLDHMVRAAGAALARYSTRFGPYPYRQIRFVERPGAGMGMHAEAMDIAYDEGFSLLDPRDPPAGLDLPFYVVAHEVSHQWWGAAQVGYARVEGAPLLTEGLAVYSGMQVLEGTYGYDQLRRYMTQVLWVSYEVPRTRASVPLLRADNGFLGYRKGPLALYALGRYIGEERVNGALRRLVEKHGSGAPPLPTTLDLYAELQAATPDSLRPLLHDLFETNTYWSFKTERATARQTAAGAWQVTLGVRARKVVVDGAGVETPVPMNDPVEIGVFAPGAGNGRGEPLYLQTHRLRSGEQTITVTVPRKPGRAGIDPSNLLMEMDDDVVEVKIEP